MPLRHTVARPQIGGPPPHKRFASPRVEKAQKIVYRPVVRFARQRLRPTKRGFA